MTPALLQRSLSRAGREHSSTFVTHLDLFLALCSSLLLGMLLPEFLQVFSLLPGLLLHHCLLVCLLLFGHRLPKVVLFLSVPLFSPSSYPSCHHLPRPPH